MLTEQSVNFQEFSVGPPTALLTAAFSAEGKQYLNVFLFQTNWLLVCSVCVNNCTAKDVFREGLF